MTRVNVVPPEELCNQHLMAEYREITRIPNLVMKGTLQVKYPEASPVYILGPGHVKFFTDKCGFLIERYGLICKECRFRGFGIYPLMTNEWMDPLRALGAYGSYVATPEAIAANRARIIDRMPADPRWSSRVRPDWSKA